MPTPIHYLTENFINLFSNIKHNVTMYLSVTQPDILVVIKFLGVILTETITQRL